MTPPKVKKKPPRTWTTVIVKYMKSQRIQKDNYESDQ
jgi:hypothetical protein